MTCEELKTFAKEVAEPKMAELLANANTPDFLRCIAKMRIEVLDCRNCGADYHIIADGYTCNEGQIYAGRHCDRWYQDEEVEEGLAWLKQSVLLAEGTVTVWNEAEQTTLQVQLYDIARFAPLFPALNLLNGIPCRSDYLPILEMLAKDDEGNEKVFDDTFDLACTVEEALNELKNAMPDGEIFLSGAELHCKFKVTSKDTKTFIFGLSPNGLLRCRESTDLLWHPVRENIESIRAGDFYLVQSVMLEIHKAWFDAKEVEMASLGTSQYVVSSHTTGEVFVAKDLRPDAAQVIRKLLENR